MLDCHLEVKQTIERAFDEKHDVDIAALELNTLKMALNMGFVDLLDVALPVTLDRIPPSKGLAHLKEVLHFFNSVYEHLGPSIGKVCPFTRRPNERIANTRSKN